VAWSYTTRLIYRRAQLKQSGKTGAQQLKETHQQLLERLYASPLVTEEQTSTALSITAQYVVPLGEVWLLYGIRLACSDGAVAHYLTVSIGENFDRYVQEGTPAPVEVHTGYGDHYFAEQVAAGMGTGGPYGQLLYPIILREREFLSVSGGAEQE